MNGFRTPALSSAILGSGHNKLVFTSHSSG